MKSAIYEGRVVHRRHAPAAHRFRYPLFMTYLDLAELDEVFRGHRLWSVERPNVVSFRRADYLGPRAVPLDRAVRDLVEARTGRRPRGPVRMLTHLRTLGHCFNPVTFYYCFDAGDRQVEAFVAAITNTPWGERHTYVLPRAEAQRRGPWFGYRFAKAFHVSPFMPMDLVHDWRFGEPGAGLAVHMENHRGGERLFDATLILRRKEISRPVLRRALLRWPLGTLRVVGAIYGQALRLWLKGVPFHPHPAKLKPPAAR